MRSIVSILLCALFIAACDRAGPGSLRDHFSYANSEQFTTRHLALDLDVDFERRELRGTATLHMEGLDRAARRIVLDTRDLHVARVMLAFPGQRPESADFRLRPADEVLGQALEIDLPRRPEPGRVFQVQIGYRTSPGSTALQWLPPKLTAGGGRPYMFSQSQSIHARSWIPLQDTPAVRMTYEATIRTPPDLLALMSANNDPRAPRTGEHRFEMPQPIPSYLIAIAAGNIHFTSIGDRTGIYSEPETLEAAAWEFADAQAMLEATEAIYGPYQWGRYDLLVLPPGFPFGGMENPRLSFITPTVLAGDRSLVSLIAHELAHSWSGNLVTNATWRDIWLNEGVTSYLDARLIELLYGRERADEERYLSYRDLLEQLETVSPAMQPLAPDLSGGNPDESRGSVHYAKGQLFLQHLEAVFGRAVFDRFLATYFRHFQWQSITSEQFLDYLDEHLLLAYPGRFTREQAGEWLYRAGIPEDATLPQSGSLEQAARLAASWAAGEVPLTKLRGQEWSPLALVQLIRSLPEGLTDGQLDELDRALQFSASRNAAINRAWFTQVARRRYQAAYPGMRRHLETVGRIYLIEPVYRALADNGTDAELAQAIFDGARDRYHPLTVSAVERALARE